MPCTWRAPHPLQLTMVLPSIGVNSGGVLWPFWGGDWLAGPEVTKRDNTGVTRQGSDHVMYKRNLLVHSMVYLHKLRIIR